MNNINISRIYETNPTVLNQTNAVAIDYYVIICHLSKF